MQLFLGNFDFEYHLGKTRRAPAPPMVQRNTAELAGTLAALADEGDCLWAPEPFDAAYAPHLAGIGLPMVRFVRAAGEVPRGSILRPWGWSSDVAKRGRENGWSCDVPPLEAVAFANSREFSGALEREWNVGVAGACRCGTLEELQRALDALDPSELQREWVVKANFGMSARERIVGRGPSLSGQARQWIGRQLAGGSAVHFEPWLDRVGELGFQFTVPPCGEPLLEGVTPLLCDSQGGYRGSRVCDRAEDAEEIDDFVRGIVGRAAMRVQALGYYGPLGIDAMQYRAGDGRLLWRPLQDINARLTMGRLALGLQRLVDPASHATWLHFRWPDSPQRIEERFDRICETLPPGVRALRTSPAEVGGSFAQRAAVLIIAPSRDRLLAAEAAVRGSAVADRGSRPPDRH